MTDGTAATASAPNAISVYPITLRDVPVPVLNADDATELIFLRHINQLDRLGDE